MRLVEKHVICHADPRYAAIDHAAFVSKHLYNKALYTTRQTFFQRNGFPTYLALYRQMKEEPEYTMLPRKVAQWVLKQVCAAWDSFRLARAAWEANPSKFLGRPRLPHYLDKQQGRNLLVYTTQALSAPGFGVQRICPSGLDITIQTRQDPHRILLVRIVPRAGYYVVEVVYDREPNAVAAHHLDSSLYAGVDIGLNNLALLTSNKVGFVPRLVNGRPVKSINQFYNQQRSVIQRQLRRMGERYTSHRLEALTNRRTRRIDHYLHTSSRRIVDLLVTEGIGTLCIGQNPTWKQGVHLGKRTNQNFVSVPHARFVAMLTYKAQLVGIQVVITEESYTSKASFLDGDLLPIYNSKTATQPTPTFSGQRIKRGLYRASDGRHINADANGGYNIIRKVAPDAFAQGSRGCVVHPVRLAV
jgi:IS605 OrfB family transposase